MNKFLILFLSILTLNLKAAPQFYRFNPQHGEFKKELKEFFSPVFNEGRMQIYRLKKKMTDIRIPKHLLTHLVKIKMNEWKVIHPQKLKGTLEPSPFILSKIAELSLPRVTKHLEFMTNQKSRSSGSKGNKKTVNYIQKYLKEHNYKTTTHCFGPELCNVWGLTKGKVDEYVLIEAHLDSVGRPFAGADDNASGTAVLLELARLLSTGDYKRGLIIFATNGEEDGLLGSRNFVKEAEKSGLLEKIFFFINMDMVAWNENGIVDIETNRPFEHHARWVSSVTNTYTRLRPEITMPAWGSDHVPFLRKNIPGVLTIEHWKTRSPCYHANCDTLDSLKIPYLMEIAKLNLATSIYKLNE